MLMMEPPPPSIMPGRKARIMRYMLSTVERHAEAPLVLAGAEDAPVVNEPARS